MIVYLVHVSEDRLKFGLTKNIKNLQTRLRTYRTIVPDAFVIKAWEVHDSAYVEENLKKRFEHARIRNANGRLSEVIRVPTNGTPEQIQEIIEGIVERSNAGFPTPTTAIPGRDLPNPTGKQTEPS